jgi:hypothetical protein
VTTIRPAAEAAARAAIGARVAAILERVGARRADGELDAAAVVADPAATGEVCAFFARGHRDREGRPTIDRVIGPGRPGAILAYETARQLGVGLAVDRQAIAAGDRVVLVGPDGPDGAMAELVLEVEAAGAEVVGCHAIIGTGTRARSVIASSVTGRRYPFQALWRPRARSIEPAGR